MRIAMLRLENYKAIVRATDRVLYTARTEAEMMTWIERNCSVKDANGTPIYVTNDTEERIALRRTFSYGF